MWRTYQIHCHTIVLSVISVTNEQHTRCINYPCSRIVKNIPVMHPWFKFQTAVKERHTEKHKWIHSWWGRTNINRKKPLTSIWSPCYQCHATLLPISSNLLSRLPLCMYCLYVLVKQSIKMMHVHLFSFEILLAKKYAWYNILSHFTN